MPSTFRHDLGILLLAAILWAAFVFSGAIFSLVWNFFPVIVFSGVSVLLLYNLLEAPVHWRPSIALLPPSITLAFPAACVFAFGDRGILSVLLVSGTTIAVALVCLGHALLFGIKSNYSSQRTRVPRAANSSIRHYGNHATRRVIAPAVVVLTIAVVFTFLATQCIWTVSGLESTCKEKTRAYFVARQDTPTDWTPIMVSTLGDVSSLYGRWRVGTKHQDVMCSATLGRPIDRVGYEIGETK